MSVTSGRSPWLTERGQEFLQVGPFLDDYAGTGINQILAASPSLVRWHEHDITDGVNARVHCGPDASNRIFHRDGTLRGDAHLLHRVLVDRWVRFARGLRE